MAKFLVILAVAGAFLAVQADESTCSRGADLAGDQSGADCQADDETLSDSLWRDTTAVKHADKEITADLFDGTVKLPGVTLKGEQTWWSESGDKRAFAYYGYKYGQARRFEHSVANTDFTYLDNPDRVRLGHSCHQLPIKAGVFDVLFSQKVSESEDCLHLDVYLPPIEKEQAHTWPVLFWVHGGGFKLGHKDIYNGSILAAATDAIVVTVNYRLGIFGFLSTGDEAAPGNFAIGDLKLALNWTLANIARFGGDPSKITIFGESAGGCLISAMMLDDQVQRQVFAAVAMSGGVVGGMLKWNNPAHGARKFATELSCPTDTSAALVECLRQKPVQALNATAYALEKDGAIDLTEILYAPVLDGHHIPKEPAQILMERAPSTDRVGTFITGYMADDAAFFLATMPTLLEAPFDYTIASQLVSGFIAAGSMDCPQNIPVKVKLVMDYYKLTESNSPEELRKGFFKISTDMMFGLGAMAESILYAKAGQNNQMYVVSYDPGFMGLGAFHSLELLHMFRGPLDILLKEKMSDSLTRSLHDYFRQVAHNGRGAGPSFGVAGNYQELDQQANWVNRQQNFAPLLEFWQTLTVLPCPPVVSP